MEIDILKAQLMHERHKNATLTETYAQSRAKLYAELQATEARNATLREDNKQLRAQIQALLAQLYWKPTHERNFKSCPEQD